MSLHQASDAPYLDLLRKTLKLMQGVHICLEPLHHTEKSRTLSFYSRLSKTLMFVFLQINCQHYMLKAIGHFKRLSSNSQKGKWMLFLSDLLPFQLDQECTCNQLYSLIVSKVAHFLRDYPTIVTPHLRAHLQQPRALVSFPLIRLISESTRI